MIRVVKAVVGLTYVAALLLPFGARASTFCEAILTEEIIQAAVFEIDYGSDTGIGEVIVIKNGDPKPEPRSENPESDETGDRKERPEMDIPRPETQLEIVVPTPSRRKDEVPVTIIIPPVQVPNPKTPPKPLPN